MIAASCVSHDPKTRLPSKHFTESACHPVSEGDHIERRFQSTEGMHKSARHALHRWMAAIVAPPLVDAPMSDGAARALQLVSVALQGVNNMTKVPPRIGDRTQCRQA